MTVEEIELRKILTQMLADAGINRETLKDYVFQILNEKIDKAIHTVECQINVDKKIDNAWNQYVRDGIDKAARAAISNRVNGYFNNIRVTLDFGGSSIHT